MTTPRYLLTLLASTVLVFAVACGPTGQVKVERHLVCSVDGTNCQTVETQQQEASTADIIWRVLFLIALANAGH